MSKHRERLLALAGALMVAVAAVTASDAVAGPPAEPLVLTDIPQIGERGGDLRMMVSRTRDTRLLNVYGNARLVGYDLDLELQPDIVADFSVEEGRIFTLRLREGHRWSDGEPFTTEDLRFYWEDVATNEELSPVGPPVSLLVEDVPPEVEVIDELTIRYTWPSPNPFFLAEIAAASPLYIYRPAHYLKQFHKDYVDPEELERLVSEDNARDWTQLYHRRDRMNQVDNVDLPTLQPWKLDTPSPADIRVMTAPTPMMMPSIVRADRSLFAVRARNAIRTLSRKFTLPPPSLSPADPARCRHPPLPRPPPAARPPSHSP